MKKLFVISFYIFNSYMLLGQENLKVDKHNLEWNVDYNMATKISKEENKPMLVFFTGSDWCGACKMLDENYFSKRKFRKLSTNFVLIELDYLKDKSKIDENRIEIYRQLKRKFKVDAFPTTIILDKNENEIGRIIGYREEKTSKVYSAFLKQFLN